MKKKNKPLFTWDAETGTATCTVKGDRNEIYTGIAKCHPDDKDMMSEKTGCEIALRRARIQAEKAYINELKISLKALQQLYYSMNTSTKFNPKSYEYKMLNRQINSIKLYLEVAKENVEIEQNDLRDFITKKESFYSLVRKNRKKANRN